MTERPPTTTEDSLAAKRFYTLGAVRIASIVLLLLGLAIARQVVEGPYWLGVVFAVGGMLSFFFAPYHLAKRWRSERSDDHE